MQESAPSSEQAAAAESSATMTAVVQDSYGPPERVLRPESVARPVPGPGEVLVRMRASSVNTPDWITATGVPAILRLTSGLRRPSSRVRGTDVAGTVAAVGGKVTDLTPGEAVFGSMYGSSRADAGAFAEYAAVPAERLRAKPDGVSFEQAAASVMSGLTALALMRDIAQVGPGTRVLVNGASGGVGTFAVQIAKSLGAEVTGVCSTRNLELVTSLGADHVVDYTRQDYTRGGRRYDVVLDNVLNHRPRATARALAKGGMLIPSSVGSGSRLLAGLPRMLGAMVLGWTSATTVKFGGPAYARTELDAMATLLQDGTVTPVIDRTYPLHEAGAAVAHMAGRRARGNVVVTME